jgi:hypothetical protein
MLDIQHHIIARLKQQPKQGMPPKKPTKAELGGFKSGIDAAADSIEMLANSNAMLLNGTGILITEMQKLGEYYRSTAQSALFLEDRNKDLAESFGMSINQATRLGGVLDKNAKNFKIGGDALRRYTQNLKGLIGNFATVNDLMETANGADLMRTQKILQTNLKLTGAQANKYEQYAAGVGKSSAETLIAQKAIADKIELATGQTGIFSEIVGEVANLSEDLQIQYGKIPGQLELGILKAKALGFEMQDLNDAGQNLLNIESSIGQELEYQLLSGRRLTDQSGKSLTNAYREATLQGDASKQAETLNTILEQEGDTLKNNLFARKQMSELLGTDEASLSRALQKKSILEKIGGEALFNLSGQELLSAAKGLGASAEDLEAIADSEDKRTTDEKMVDMLDLMTTEGIVAMIKNPADVQAGNASATLQGMESTSTALTSAVAPLTAELAGAGWAAKQFTGALYDGAAAIGRIISGGVGVNVKQYGVADASVSNGGTKLASGGVIPPGYPNDSFPAMLTSGETVTPVGGTSPDVAQLAAAIVSAINNQTKALTSAGFGDYYG